MKTSPSIVNISKALVAAQSKMGAATKGASNPYFKSKYADLGSVMEVVKGPLNEASIAVLQPTSSDATGNSYVSTVLLHSSGEYIESEPLKLEIPKGTMQDLGSAISYARRYTLQSLLSVPAEDDDAESTMNRSTKTAVPAKAASTSGTVTLSASPATQAPAAVNTTAETSAVATATKKASSFKSFGKPLTNGAAKAASTVTADDGFGS